MAALVDRMRLAGEAWAELQEYNREGWNQALQRVLIQRKILDTPPIFTAENGPCEVRVLAGRQDWMNAIWALKSFYFFAKVDYPLYIHDGGLSQRQTTQLASHFPGAIIVTEAESDHRTAQALGTRWFYKSLQCRRKEIGTRKFFDFFALSNAAHIISIDTSVVFFRRPAELLAGSEYLQVNRYSRDPGGWYSMPADQFESRFGIRAPEHINAGLCVVRRESIDFELIEHCLRNANRLSQQRVTEHTLHTLISTIAGSEFLPRAYTAGVSLRWDSSLTSKQYPAEGRNLLYEEGYDRLMRVGFTWDLHRAALIAVGNPRTPRSGITRTC